MALGIGEVKKAAEQRQWGDVPQELARALMDCRRHRADTRLRVSHLWDLWPLPLQQLEQDGDEVYVDDFPELSDSFARPDDPRWDTFYMFFIKHWLTRASPYMNAPLGFHDVPAAASPLPVRPNAAEQLDFAIRACGRRDFPGAVLEATSFTQAAHAS